MTKRISADTSKRIHADRKAGMSIYAISAKYGIAQSTANMHSRGKPKPKIPRGSKAHKISQEIVESVLQARREGKTITQIAWEHDVGTRWVKEMMYVHADKVREVPSVEISSVISKQMLKDWNDGLSMLKISKKHKVTYRTVRRHLKARGIERSRYQHNHKKQDAVRKQIARDWRETQSIDEICRRTGRTRKNIMFHLREMDIKTPESRSVITPEMIQEFLKEHYAGRSTTQIAHWHGLSPGTVRKYIREGKKNTL